MMSIASIRFAMLATALAVSGALQAQAPAPAATPANPPVTPAATPGTMPAQPATAPGATPPSTPAAAAATDTPAPAKEKKKRSGNFMRANPDASPVLPGQTTRSSAPTTKAGSSAAKTGGGATGAAAGAATGATATGAAPTTKKTGTRSKQKGMQRAFQDLQTTDEFNAYYAKAKNVKSVAECRTLIDSTKKELEPRAKAQNKSITVDSTEICDRAQQRGRLSAG